jgi:hypothetical protein
MSITNRLSKSMQLILSALFPARYGRKNWKARPATLKPSRPGFYLTVSPDEIHSFFTDPGETYDSHKSITIFIPEVLPLTAPFLLFYLKRNGFSGCRAEVANGGLIVHASR